MSTKYGIVTNADNDYSFISGAGREVVSSWITAALVNHNEDNAALKELFVERQTINREIRYNAPGGGFSQVIGRQSAPEMVKRGGDWLVGFPLYGTADGLGFTKQGWAKMTAGEFENRFVTVMDRNTNLRSNAMLSAILSNNARVFHDEDYGANVTVQPLANGTAGELYPPIRGSAPGSPDAIQNHYLTAANMDAASFAALIDHVLHHYGWTQSGDNMVVLAHPTEAALIAALAGFSAVEDRFSNSSTAATWAQSRVPSAPGLTIGRYQGVWVNEYRQMPEHYVYAQHLDYAAPLMERINPDLPLGFNLSEVRSEFPLTTYIFDDYYGFGVGNRLNGAVLQITAGDYEVPTDLVRFEYAAF